MTADTAYFLYFDTEFHCQRQAKIISIETSTIHSVLSGDALLLLDVIALAAFLHAHISFPLLLYVPMQ